MAFQKGQSGNPKGPPKRGQAWGEIIREISELTVGEMLERVGGPDSVYGQLIAALPRTVQVKHMLATRAIIELLNDPQATMLTAIMERTDGRPITPVDIGPLQINVTYDDTIGAEAVADDE